MRSISIIGGGQAQGWKILNVACKQINIKVYLIKKKFTGLL